MSVKKHDWIDCVQNPHVCVFTEFGFKSVHTLNYADFFSEPVDFCFAFQIVYRMRIIG